MAATKQYQRILESIEGKAKTEKRENKKFFDFLKKKKPVGMTKSLRQFNDEAFSKAACLDCANCCRVAMPVFEMPDIRRISSHFAMTNGEFIKKYLKADPDYEYLTKKTPCYFLGDDNKCTIYEIRPLGCRTYPPAKLQLSDEQLDVLHDNVGICPAVNEMVDKMKEKFEAAM